MRRVDGVRPMRGVLVTGGSRGIGRAVALAFARGGDRVAVQYAGSRADAEETLRQLPGEGHTLLQADLGSPARPSARWPRRSPPWARWTSW